ETWHLVRQTDTLCHWLKQGKITAKTSPFGTHLYNISSIFPELTSHNTTTTTTTKKGFLYARVSSTKQKEDLEQQKQLLRPDFQLMNSSVTLAQMSTSNDQA